RDGHVTGVQTCALPISLPAGERGRGEGAIPASTAACSAGLDQGCSPGLLRTTSQKAAARTTPGAAITSRDALQGSANTPIRSVEIGRASCRERVEMSGV